MRIVVLGAGHVGRAIVGRALRGARDHGHRHQRGPAARRSPTATTSHGRGRRHDQAGDPRGGHPGLQPVHRVHVAGGGEPRLARCWSRSSAARAGRRADDERRVPRRVARARDRRRLHGLLRARDGERDLGLIGIPAARQTDVFADGQGADRRVRRPADATTAWSAQPLQDARRCPQDSKVVEHHPRRRGCVSRAATRRSCPATGSS